MLNRRSAIARAIVLALAVAAACAPTSALQPPAVASDNTAARRAFEGHTDGVELTITGTVDRVLSDQSGPAGPHERFVVALADVSMTVLIEHNLSIAPRVPVAAREAVVVHGEYVWNAQGGLVHFTHHDPDHSHEDGYILYAGKRYD